MKKILSIVALTLIFMCGVIFTGCGPSYSSLSLSFSSEIIEMLRTDEGELYTITVENYFEFDAQFNFSFEKPIARVVDDSLKHVGKGVFTFSISPLIAGETQLCITLRGTGKQITVPVYIKEDIVSFEPVENIFISRGTTLSLDESLFTFTPADTTEKSFTYEFTEEYLDVEGVTINNNVLSVENNLTTQELNQVDILVTSKSKPTLNKVITVKIVNGVEQEITKEEQALKITAWGISKDGENSFFDSTKEIVLFNDGSLTGNLVELVINNDLEFQKQINVQLNDWGVYSCDVYTNNEKIEGDLSKNTPIKGKNENFSFAVQVSDIGEVSFKIKFYQSDFVANFVEYEIKIKATTDATSIKINGQNSIGIVEFYTHGSEPRDFNFTVFPESSLKDTNYIYNIELFSYAGDEYPLVVSDGDTNFTKQTALPNSHLLISYDGKQLLSLDDMKNLTSLSYLTLQPEGAYEYAYAFKVVCLKESGEVLCSNVMYVKIYVGATHFGVNPDYEDNTIYISADSPSVAFNDFIYTEGSTIGMLTIMQKYLEEPVCDIEQLPYSVDITKPTLLISPKKVGTTDFTLITPNGLAASFRVVVVRLITENDFVINLTNENSNNISSFEEDENGSLKSVIIKGNKETTIVPGMEPITRISGIAYTEAKILNYSDVNNISYSYTMTYEGSNYEITNNRIVNAKAFTETELETINVTTKIAEINNFKLNYNEFYYNFDVKCVQYIKNLTISANNSLDDENRLKYVSVYNQLDLSYKNQNMAEAYIYMKLEKSGETVFNSEDITLKSWSIVGLSYSEQDDIEAKENLSNSYGATVGSIGYFYPNYQEDASYVGKFVCSIPSVNTTNSFTISLTITDNSTGLEFTDTVTITIEKYISVDSIWLRTGTDNIYLDNTAENRTKSISVYVMPVNATFKEIAISVQTTSTNCIDWQFIGDVITFSFVSAGEGKIYIYPVCKMKVSNEIPDYNICLDFVCADGEFENTALKLSTFEDLQSIQPNKHYYIDSIIDCGGRELYIKDFNSTLRGTFVHRNHEGFETAEQVGGITNYVVKDNASNNYGLFGELGSSAIVYNIEFKGVFKNSEKIEGSKETKRFEFTLSNNTNMGLLVGTNNGTLLNVNVGLYGQNTLYLNSTKADMELNLGLVAGSNKGNIIVDANAKNSTLFIANTEESEFISYIVGEFQDANFGGVVGANQRNAKIEYLQGVYDSNEEPEEENFISLGLYGVSVNIFANLYNFKNIGGIVGSNYGEITNCKVMGELTRSKQDSITYQSNTGGIIGIQYGDDLVQNNKSRIYLRGTGNVSGLIGALAPALITNNENIKNNLVQATDTGRYGIDASLIVGIQQDATIYPITNYELNDDTNKAYTYISRTKVDHSQISNTLELSRYYGDILKITNAGVIYSDSADVFEKGTDDADFSNAIEFMALAIYSQAFNELEQQLIDNSIHSKDILDLAEINNVKEVNLSVSNISVANIVNYGKKLNLFKTGLITLTISSSLNYKNKCSISIYFTNYFDDINIYSNKDKTQELPYLELYNSNSANLYLDCYANNYSYKNQAVRLVGNSEIEFEYEEILENLYDKYKLDIDTAKQTIFVKAKENMDDETQINIYPVLKIEDKVYYLYKEASLYESTPLKVFKLDNLATKEKIENFDVVITTGIDNIRLSKTFVMAEATDKITFDVVYTSYNEDDELQPTLVIGDKKYNLNAEGYFINSANEQLFKLTKEVEDALIPSTTNTYKATYSLSMVLSNEVYYNMGFYNAQKTIRVVFESVKTHKTAFIDVEYSPETISSVIINNYSYEENEGMIVESADTLLYQEDLAIKSSAFSSTGDLNIISTYVFTNLSEFSYVDVSMNVGQTGGYLAYVDKDGKISKDGFITSLGSVVTLRIYKDKIINKDELFEDNVAKALKFNILYSLPQDLADQTIVPIVLDFYKQVRSSDGETTTNVLCYTKETTVISKAARQVSFKIYGKDAIESSRREYRVARGMRYALETTIIGFTDEEVHFDISSPVHASIEQIAGVYYLTITSNEIKYPQSGTEVEDFKGGYKVTIKSYGEKQSGNMALKSREQITDIFIYEVCLEKEPFELTPVDLKVLQVTDIKNIFASKLNLECNNTLVYRKSNEVKQNIINNAKYTLIYGDKEIPLNSGINSSSIPNLTINGYNLTALAMINDMELQIRVDFAYKYDRGVPVIVQSTDESYKNAYTYSKKFDITSYLSTSEEIPDPIFTYQDLLKVRSDENYRLVNDITIKLDEFNMITATPSTFDGNGYTIYIEGGSKKLNDMESFGIFETIAEGAVFKNVNIVVKNNITLTFDCTYSSGLTFGLLSAQNNGSITNCSVQSGSVINVNVVGTPAVIENSILGTLCATNSGYITNSQVVANITVNGATVGGLVAKNESTGHISSCYVKNSRIFNTTSVTGSAIVTAGLCARNYGNISLSFVEGSFGYKIYCTYEKDNYGLTSKIIYTSTLTAGFVYENAGKISDSYSNIPLVSSTSCAGFVGVNKSGAVIERTYSLSQMNKNDTLNFGYVYKVEENSVFKDCFFAIEDGFINGFTDKSNYNYNNMTYSEKIPGVIPLKLEQFSIYNSSGQLKQDTPFKNFIISKNSDTRSGVWFAVYDSLEEEKSLYDTAYLVSASELSIYNKSTNKFVAQEFASRRPQLVSANFLAYSKLLINEKDGEYEYYSEDPIINAGTEYNPYVISNATQLENYINNSRVYEYFRIINNINYLDENIYTSNTYSKTLLGYIEGNNFKISKYAINSKASLSYAGLIAQFGNKSRNMSILKNATFEPTYINLPNSVTVGAIVGCIENACIYNVSVQGEDLIVTGKNIVGGLFGQTVGLNDISNVQSNVTAKATRYSASLELKRNDVESLIQDISLSPIGTNKDSLSYSGSLIGYISGDTTVNNAHIGELAKSYSIIAGLMFGGVGETAKVTNINLQLNSYNNEVKAFAFGGIVAGELKGTVSDVTINSNILNKELFSCYPITPIAIGGIAGIVNGGSINNINSEEGYSVIGTAFTGEYVTHEHSGLVTEKIKNPYVVKYVGGIAGYLRGVNSSSSRYSVYNVIISELIVSGGNYVGGVIGYVNNDTLSATLRNVDINLSGHKKYINQNNEEIDELVYTSYVSQFVSENLPSFVFNNNQRFGLVIGALSNVKNKSQVTLTNVTFRVDTPDANKPNPDNVVGLYCYYAYFTSSGANDVNNIVGGLSSDKYKFNSDDMFTIYFDNYSYESKRGTISTYIKEKGKTTVTEEPTIEYPTVK